MEQLGQRGPQLSCGGQLAGALAPKCALEATLSAQRAAQLPFSRLAQSYLLEPTRRLEETLDYYLDELWTRTTEQPAEPGSAQARWLVFAADPRTSQLPLVRGGPWKLLFATLVYLYLIKRLLPGLMGGRKALELTWTIRAYNLLMVVSNLFAFLQGVRLLDWGRRCFGCQLIAHSDRSPEALELLHYGWLFLLSRLVEWLDTIFFVLRKKEQQVTKLHVFHHSFVPLISWTYLKFHPGYTVAFFPLVNTFVHTIMYAYYLLATFGPQMAPYLWWKRYLTSLQIAQFVAILVQLASIPLSSHAQCQYPRSFLMVAFSGAVLFLWLFYTYYLDTYRPSAPPCRRRVKFALVEPGRREGSSCALADAIEDAIGADAPTERCKLLDGSKESDLH